MLKKLVNLLKTGKKRHKDFPRETEKKLYDYKIRCAHFLPRDRLLVKVMAFDGRHKLVDKWTDEVYTVVRQVNQEVPVFDFQREDGKVRYELCT